MKVAPVLTDNTVVLACPVLLACLVLLDNIVLLACPLIALSY